MIRGWLLAALLGAARLHAAPAETAEPPTGGLNGRVEGLETKVDSMDLKVQDIGFRLTSRENARRIAFEGYADIGYYIPEGTGAGFRRDTGNTLRERFPDVPWIFLGDPWSVPVNSRGEPADTDGSRAIPFDEVDSAGRSSFIVNEVNLDAQSPLTENATAFASVDFLPRSGTEGRTGDRLDLDFAYLEWRPRGDRSLIVEAGKFRSAFGLEYRRQESPDRIGVSPSLIHRYVGGHPIGIKGRYTREVETGGAWVANLAVQNGNSHIETFSFAEELDANDGKTVSGRISRSFEELEGADFIEIGLSGETGSQSRQPDAAVDEDQWGLDLVYEKGDHELRVEWVKGSANGGGEAAAASLEFRGLYAEYACHLGNQWTPYLRGELRKALHQAQDFVYVMDISRWTVGVRYEVAPRWIMKAEYLKNLEEGPVPEFDNDLVLFSQVLVF